MLAVPFNAARLMHNTLNPKRRVAFVLVDGLGDVSLPAFGNKTPLQVANLPNLDAIASAGINGLMDPVEVGLACGSDTAHLSLMGYDPQVYYKGRGALESMGAGLAMLPGDIAFKSNFATLDETTGIIISRRADRHFGKEGPILCAALDGMKLSSFPEYEVRVRYATEHRCGVVVRGPRLSGNISGTDPLKDNRKLLQAKALEDTVEATHTAAVVNELSREMSQILASHSLNAERAKEGKSVANVLLFRGCGIRIEVCPFEKNHGLRPCMVAPTKIITGLGLSLGIDILQAPGGTGDYRTLLTSKVTAIAKALSAPLLSCPPLFVLDEVEHKPGRPDGYDFGFLHIKAVDDAGHDRQTSFKVKALEAVDRAVGQLAKHLWQAETTKMFNFFLVVTGDHSTPVEYGDHSFEPVPFTMCPLKDFVGAAGGESILMETSLDPFPLLTVRENDYSVEDKMQNNGRMQGKAFSGDSVHEFSELAATRGFLGRFPGGELMDIVKAYLQL